MKHTNQKLTNSCQKNITFDNSKREEKLKKAIKNMEEDSKKSLRGKTCKVCFYLKEPVLAMQAFFDWNCAICLKDQAPWPSSDVPKICAECSETHNCCPVCGGDSDLVVKDKNL